MGSSSLTGTEFARISGSYSTAWIGSYTYTQDARANTTTLTLYGTVYYGGGTRTRSNNSSDVLEVNGVTISPPTPYEYRYASDQTYGYAVTPGYSLFGSTTKTVQHNADGTFPATQVSVYGNTFHFDGSDTGTISGLPKLDRTAPTVTLSLASRTSNSLTVNATASATCDYWEFSRDDGSTFPYTSSTEGTAASYTFTGLSPNTTYNIKVRARKKTNYVKGTSARGAYTTIGNALLNSVAEVYADASTVIIKPNMTVYGASFTYTLEIKRGNTSILTLSIPAQSTGTKDVSVTLTSAQRTTLLSGMSNVASFSATYILKTLNNGTQVGSTSSATATIRTSSSTSAPGQASFSYADTNAKTVAVTGDSTKLVQGQSTLRLTNLTATAKNGASVASYNITIGGVTKSVTSGGTVEMGVIPQSGTLTLSVVVTDTRGYTSTRTVSVTSYAYSLPSISTYSVKRNASTSTQIDMSFSGVFSNIGSNTVTATYKYKQTTASSYSAETSVTPTKSGSTFSYSGTNIATFDDEYVYDFVITLSDGIITETYYITVPSYNPLMAFRPNGVGFGMIPQNDKSVEIADDWSIKAYGKFNETRYYPYSFQTLGGSNTDGYAKIATITITQAWNYSPIVFEVSRLTDFCPITLYLRFAGGNTTTPTFFFAYSGMANILGGYPFDAFVVRTNSVYDVYVKKVSAGDRISVRTYMPYYEQNNGCIITYSDALMTSVPSGAQVATPMDTYGVYYGTCTTAAATAAKVATVNALPMPLVAGTTVCIVFTNLNQATPSDITLNVQTTGYASGAKGVRWVNNGVLTTLPSVSSGSMLAQNAPCVFVYNGTYWVLISSNYYVNTTYSAMSQSEANTGTATTARTITAAVLDAKIKNVNKDFVVEHGTSGNWTYRKWNSGDSECWGTHSMSVTGWSAWGVLYETNGAQFTYPSGLFVAEPNYNATPRGSGGLMMESTGAGSKTQTPKLYAVRPNAGGTDAIYWYIHARGKWK